jgi:hypothetical protein
MGIQKLILIAFTKKASNAKTVLLGPMSLRYHHLWVSRRNLSQARRTFYVGYHISNVTLRN